MGESGKGGVVKVKVKCPKCGRTGYIRWERDRHYHRYYMCHDDEGRECYIGKNPWKRGLCKQRH